MLVVKLVSGDDWAVAVVFVWSLAAAGGELEDR